MDNALRQHILDLLDQACASDIFAAVSRDEWIEEVDALPACALALLPRHLTQLMNAGAPAQHRHARHARAGQHVGHRQTLSAAASSR